MGALVEISANYQLAWEIKMRDNEPSWNMIEGMRVAYARTEYRCAGCGERIVVNDAHICWTAAQHICLGCWPFYVQKSCERVNRFADKQAFVEGKQTFRKIQTLLRGKRK